MSWSIDVITITESNTFIYSCVYAVVQMFIEMIVVTEKWGLPDILQMLENELFLDITIPMKSANNLKCENTGDNYKLKISYMV